MTSNINSAYVLSVLPQAANGTGARSSDFTFLISSEVISLGGYSASVRRPCVQPPRQQNRTNKMLLCSIRPKSARPSFILIFEGRVGKRNLNFLAGISQETKTLSKGTFTFIAI